MLKLFICCILLIIGFVLYCCIRCGAEYDREFSDKEQEEFLRNWK